MTAANRVEAEDLSRAAYRRGYEQPAHARLSGRSTSPQASSFRSSNVSITAVRKEIGESVQYSGWYCILTSRSWYIMSDIHARAVLLGPNL